METSVARESSVEILFVYLIFIVSKLAAVTWHQS